MLIDLEVVQTDNLQQVCSIKMNPLAFKLFYFRVPMLFFLVREEAKLDVRAREKETVKNTETFPADAFLFSF